MSVHVRRFSPAEAEAWDAFAREAHQGTLLHTRAFLSYHGHRFLDLSLFLLDEAERLIGLLPAAAHPKDETCVVSHPGSTYGGVVHQGELKGEKMVEALTAIAHFYAQAGAERLVYKPVPSLYHRVPAQDDLYALFRLGARRIGCDLSSAIDLERRLPVSSRRRRSLAKARKAGLEIVEGNGFLAPLWAVVEENFARKHGAKPVHTLEEMALLAQRFPEEIKCVCAASEGTIIAGVVLFETPTVSRTQYIASSPLGYDLSALDAVFEVCIAAAGASGRKWFDFGGSTREEGWVLNEGLYRFKSEFGGGGVLYEACELALAR
jgi:hypothetical protein